MFSGGTDPAEKAVRLRTSSEASRLSGYALTEWTRTNPRLIWQGRKGAAAVRLCVGRVVNVTADERVMADGKVDISRVDAIAFDPYTHGYYRVTERVGEAFKDGLKLKK